MTETGIIYLQKDKFDFYSLQNGKVIEFRFVPEIVRDLEIVNFELLDNLIRLFIDENKIVPTEMIVVLSDNACFIKDFVIPPASSFQPTQPTISGNESAKKLQEDIQYFIDHVPFENVQSRTFETGNGTKVLAVNQDFYSTIKDSFEKSDFKISAVYPGVVFGNNISTMPVMDIVSANLLFEQSESLRADNLLLKDVNPAPVVEKEKEKKEKEFTIQENESKPGEKNKIRLFIMIGVFAILIIILIFVYLGSLQQNP